MAIAHTETQTQILDLIRELKPKFSPEAVMEEFAKIIRSYRCTKVYGDRYGGEWPREQFRKHGVNYECEKSKSELYRDLLPLINSGAVDLFEHDRLVTQLTSLRAANGTRREGLIDHAPGAHDDIANAVAGALVTAYKEPGVPNFRNVIVFPKQPREGRAREGHVRLFPRVQVAALVGDRRVADRREHLRRADRRHVGLGLCDRPRDRLLRMDGRADAADRRQIFPADLPREQDLHDAAVPRAAVRPRCCR